MKRFQINEVELKYLAEILDYMDDDTNEPLSTETRQRVNEVIMKVQSRPVMDIVIDPKVLKEAHDKFTEEQNND